MLNNIPLVKAAVFDGPDDHFFLGGDKTGFSRMLGVKLTLLIFNGFQRIRNFSFAFKLYSIEKNLALLR